MRHRFRGTGDDHADVGLLRLEALPGRLHVVHAAAAELRRVDECIHREEVRGVVLDHVAFDLRRVLLLRLPVIGPRARAIELFLVVDERGVLQRVRRAGARRDHLPGLVPEVAQVRHLALTQLFQQPFFHAQDHLGRRQQPGDVEARRAARGADLGVVLRGGAGGIVDHLDAELLLEWANHHPLDELLVFPALRVDDQRFLRPRRDDVGCRHRHGGLLQEPAA